MKVLENGIKINEGYAVMRKSQEELKRFILTWDIPKLQSAKFSRYDGWIVLKINGRYYYIIVGLSGLFFCIASASLEEKKMVMRNNMSLVFYFNQEDKIMVKNSLNTENVPDELETKLNERSFRDRYGMGLYDLKDHLICVSAGLLKF